MALTLNLRKKEAFDLRSLVVRALNTMNELDFISSFSFHDCVPSLPENKVGSSLLSTKLNVFSLKQKLK